MYAGHAVPGPETCPSTPRPRLTSSEKKAIISFSSRTTRRPADPGGLPLGGFGPAPGGPDRLPGGYGRDRGDHVVDGVPSITSHSEVEVPSEAELAAMSQRRELSRARRSSTASNSSIAGRRFRARARQPSKQAQRSVAKWFLLAGLAWVLFSPVALIWWPQGYQGACDPNEWKCAAVHPDPRRHHGAGHRRLRNGRHLAGQDRSARGGGPGAAPGRISARGGSTPHAGRGDQRRGSPQWADQAPRGASRARCLWPAAGSGWSPPCRSSAA